MDQVTGVDHSKVPSKRWGCAIFDDRSLSIFRILFGLTLLLNNLLRTCEGRLEAFYTDEGILPRALMFSQRTSGWSLLDAFSSLSEARIAFALITMVYVAYTIGLFTRYTKWLAVLCLISLYHRNLLVNDGSDWVMRFLALWTAFLPLGRRWSIDSRFFRGARFLNEPGSRLATIGFCVNLSLSYLLNFLQKDGYAWSSGDAVRRVLWNAMVGTPLAVATRESALCPFLDTLTYATISLELALSIMILLSLRLVWARRITFFMILILHGGFGSMLYLGTFVPIYLATAFIFLPGRDLDRFRWTRSENSPRVVRSWFAGCLAVMMCAWCAVMLVLENPIVPERIRTGLLGVVPQYVRVWMHVPGISQRWYMFTAPSLETSALLIAARRQDGSLVDRYAKYHLIPKLHFSAPPISESIGSRISTSCGKAAMESIASPLLSTCSTRGMRRSPSSRPLARFLQRVRISLHLYN